MATDERLAEIKITTAVASEPPWAHDVPMPPPLHGSQRWRDENPDAVKRQGDLLIARTMRFAVWGLGAIAVLFVTYILATLYIGAHDNRRLDELERRVQKLEAR